MKSNHDGRFVESFVTFPERGKGAAEAVKYAGRKTYLSGE